MFNMTGSEVMFLLIIGLVVLGPEKLPDAIRRVGRLYAELKRMSSGVQTDFRKVMEEPLKEMMNTTNTVKSLFSDTTNEFKSAAKELVDPTFIPYETSEVPKVISATDSKPQDAIATKTAEDLELEVAIARAAKIAQDKKDDEPINNDFYGDDNSDDNGNDNDDKAKEELSPTLDQVT
ncbi:MAG: Sec-independent protein translocase protein TatB [Actinomycetota bacterium]|nr:Sec-independent protein translocase protein TatB [Actinomycetota bacterium]